jgi:hypothetical protein
MKIMEPAWNQAFEDYSIINNEKAVRSGDRVWATELGKAPIDVFLRMKGTEPSNPPDARAQRKFEAGNIWEQIIGIVLKRAGVLIDSQKWVAYQYPNMMKVSGYLDYKTGGFIDWKKAKEVVESDEFAWLPDRTKFATKRVIENLAVEFPSGLPEMILEIKSTSGFMYDNYLNTGASENHILQLYHYLKAENLDIGNIVYVDRDSVRMIEFPVVNGQYEDLYKERIKILTDYIASDERPPLEPFVVFNENAGSFSTNWRVVYSNYLTLLYEYEGKVFEHGEEVRDFFKPKVTQWNSLLKRIAGDKNLTAKNLEWYEDLKTMFSDKEIDSFVNIVKEKLVKKLKEKENDNE